MRIIIDAHGGDNAPLEIIMGCAAAVEKMGLEFLLCGKSEVIKEIMRENSVSSRNIDIAEAAEVIDNNEDPVTAIRQKKNSSLVTGLRLLRDGEGDGFLSAGSTGALLAGATLIVKRMEHVQRAALATVMPTRKGAMMLIDCGANAEAGAPYLLQFGQMGAAYMRGVMGINEPTVGLLNIGAERAKGTDVQREAYSLLEQSGLNFIGNVEGRDILSGGAQVVVADGFSGNVALKVIEGVAGELTFRLKGVLMKNIWSKLAALMLKGGLNDFKKALDYHEYGGAPLLGIAKPVIKAHGSSDRRAFLSAIGQCKSMIEGEVTKKIAAAISDRAELSDSRDN